MKILFSLFSVALLVGSAIPTAEARREVSVDFFYETLAASGTWQTVGEYGYCWRPNDLRADWSPYSEGQWVYTDAGWTWSSDEPYSWAVYHYGRWINVERLGWFWVPGTEWGPGWVSWRSSSRYVGWAPLPPEARFVPAVGLGGWVDDHYDIGPGSYRFVEARNFGASRLKPVFIAKRNTIWIIHHTTNVTNISYKNQVVHNGGLDYESQSRASTVPIGRYKLSQRQDCGPRNPNAEQLRFPRSLSMHPTVPERIAKSVDNIIIDRGWNQAGSSAEVATMRAKLKSNVAVPPQLQARAKTALEPTLAKSKQ